MASVCDRAVLEEAALRAALVARLREARRQTDAVFALVRPEALLVRPIAERHRLIFYVGHIEAFDWNLLCRDCRGDRSSHPDLDRLFAFGFVPSLGWDNEYDAHEVHVPAFAVESRNVTWGDFLAFMETGAYDDRAFWTGEDWEWRSRSGHAYPVFLSRRGDDFVYRGMFGEAPLGRSWPAFVSHAEASAYARWCGRALPSETQFHRAAYGAPDGRP